MLDKKGLEAIIETNTITGNRLNNAITNQQNNRKIGYSYMLDNIRGTLTNDLYDKQCALNGKIKDIYQKRNEIYGNMITALTARYYSEKLVSTQSKLVNMKTIVASLNTSDRNDSSLEKALTAVQSICTIETGKDSTDIQGYIDTLHSHGNTFYDTFSNMKSALGYSELDISSNGSIVGADNMYIIKDDDITITTVFKSNKSNLTATDIIYYNDSLNPDATISADVTITTNNDIIIQDGTSEDPYLIYSYSDARNYSMLDTSTNTTKKFKLMQDINLDKDCDNISGSIDLNGHNITIYGRNLKISNASINGTGSIIIYNTYSYSYPIVTNTNIDTNTNIKLVAATIASDIVIKNNNYVPLYLTLGDSTCSVDGCYVEFKSNGVGTAFENEMFKILYETGTGTTTCAEYEYNYNDNDDKDCGKLKATENAHKDGNYSFFRNVYVPKVFSIEPTDPTPDITNSIITAGKTIHHISDSKITCSDNIYKVIYTDNMDIFTYTKNGSVTINKSEELYNNWKTTIKEASDNTEKKEYNFFKSFSKQGSSTATLKKLNIYNNDSLNSTGEYFRILIFLAKLSTCNKILVSRELKNASNGAYSSFDELYKLCNELLALIDDVSESLTNDISDYTDYLNDYINSYSAVEAYRESNDEKYSTTYTENLSTIFQQVQSQYSLLNNEELSSENVDISSIASESEFQTYLEAFQHESLLLITAFVSSLLSLTKYIEGYTLFFGSDNKYADELENTIKIFNKGFTTNPNSSSYIFRYNSGIRNYETWKDELSKYTNDGVYGLTQLYIAQELGINMLSLPLNNNSDENTLLTMLVNDVIIRMYKKNLFINTLSSKIDEFSYEKALNNTYNIYISETAKYEVIPSVITDIIQDVSKLNNLDVSSILLNVEDPINTSIGTYLDLILIKYIFKDRIADNILSRINSLGSALESSYKNFKVLLLRYHFYKVVRELKKTLSEDTETNITFDNGSAILLYGSDDMFVSAKELLSKYIAVWLFKYYSEYSGRSALTYLGSNDLLKYLYKTDSITNLSNAVDTNKTWLENIKDKILELWNNFVNFIF